MNAYRILFSAAAFAALLVPASAASVEVSAITPTLNRFPVTKMTVVKYDDLNPAESRDAATLLDRIEHAATVLCTSNPGGTGPMLARAVEKCRTKAVKQAVRDVGTTELSEIAFKK